MVPVDLERDRRAGQHRAVEPHAGDGHTERRRLVVADPPAFAKSKKDIEPAARAYRKLARAAAGVVEPGGTLVLGSCSHHIDAERFHTECAAGIHAAKRPARLLRASGADVDHPVHPHLPETAYLKALVFALD